MLKIQGCVFDGNHIGIATSPGAAIDVSDTRFVNNGTAVLVRQPPVPATAFGLPENVPEKLLEELLLRLKKLHDAPVQVKTDVVQTSSLFRWLERTLGAGASLATISDAIIKFTSS